jgi:hypothetical protein
LGIVDSLKLTETSPQPQEIDHAQAIRQVAAILQVPVPEHADPVEAFLAGVRGVVGHLVRLRIAAANDVIRVCFIIFLLLFSYLLFIYQS